MQRESSPGDDLRDSDETVTELVTLKFTISSFINSETKMTQSEHGAFSLQARRYEAWPVEADLKQKSARGVGRMIGFSSMATSSDHDEHGATRP